MINQGLSVTPTKTRQTLFPAAETVAGVPLFVGALPFVNLDSFQANIGGATGYYDGAYFLEVTAASSLSPVVGQTINVGDPIYAKGGTRDADTNVLSGFTLCADSSGTLFGYYDPQLNSGPLPSGTTASVGVSLASKI